MTVQPWVLPVVFTLVGSAGGGLVAPAFGTVGERGGALTMTEIEELAQEYSGRRRSWNWTFDSDGDGGPVVIGVVLLILTAGYVRYRAPVLLSMTTVAVLMLAIATLVVLIAARHGVIAGTWQVFLSLLLPGVLTAVGVVDVVLLWLGAGANAQQQEALAACELVINDIGLHGLTFFAYEVMGAIVFAVSALAAIRYCVARVSAIYVVADVSGQWLWRFIFRLCMIDGGWRTWALLVLGALSVGMCSGGAAHLMEWLAQNGSSTST